MAAVDFDDYLPFASGVGSSRDEASMRKIFSLFVPRAGVKYGELNNLLAYADGTGSMAVKVKTGKGVWAGHYGEVTAEKTVTLDNPHATQDRTDLVIVRADFTTKKVVLDKLKGVEDGSLARPSLTQNTSMYEQALCAVGVANAGAPYAIESTDVSDLRTFLHELGPVCKAKRTTTQSISNNTITAAQLDSTVEARDTDAMHNPSSSPQRITIARDGLYDISGYIQFAANATGDRSVSLQVNGSDVEVEVDIPARSTKQSAGIVTASLDLVVGDFVTVCAFQTSGGSLNINDAWLDVRFRQPTVARTA